MSSQLSYAQQPGPIAGVTLSPPSTAPTGSPSSSLYGSEDLLGEVAQPVPASSGDSAEVPATDIELVKGQEAPQDLDLYLDFNGVNVPQPIRGDGGGSANGPRAYAYEKLNLDLFAYEAFATRSVHLSAVDENGQTFNDDITAGDVWFFPAGMLHSIQALDEGCEFLLVFDDGSFSKDGTFLASELFMRNPKSVLSKNFQAPVSAFENIPDQQLYISNGQPAPANFSAQNQTGPDGELPINKSYTYC